MKKTILIFVLMGVSTGTMADWIKVGGNDDFDAYSDPMSIRKSGSMVKMWVMQNYKKTSFSMKLQHEYDCDKERVRQLYASGYSGEMGKGSVHAIVNETEKWQPVPPGTIGEAFWKAACGKVKLK